MPRKLELKLRRQAKARRLSAKSTNAYVYGTLRRTGWKPKRRK